MHKVLADQEDRPQTPVPPFPYEERHVTVINTVDNTTLAGTLTIPDNSSSHPAVILIWGSGPQDRDQSIFGHKSFAVIADYLTRAGIAVLRMDKRGTGNSKSGNDSMLTTLDYAEDIKAGISFLASQKEIDPKKIGLIGHSEGGLIAAIVADSLENSGKTRAAFSVLLAAPGQDGASILKEQFLAISKANGQTICENVKNSQFELIDAIQRNEKDDTINKLLEKLILLAHFGAYHLDELSLDAKVQFDQKFTAALGVKDPWYRLFLQLDSRIYLRRVKCPVLVLNGKLDCQVISENASHIFVALSEGGNKNFQVEIFPELKRITSWIHDIVRMP
jgi:uncharacterized protein